MEVSHLRDSSTSQAAVQNDGIPIVIPFLNIFKCWGFSMTSPIFLLVFSDFLVTIFPFGPTKK
jgi:hypothetical protein